MKKPASKFAGFTRKYAAIPYGVFMAAFFIFNPIVMLLYSICEKTVVRFLYPTLFHISAPTGRYAISYAGFFLKTKT